MDESLQQATLERHPAKYKIEIRLQALSLRDVFGEEKKPFDLFLRKYLHRYLYTVPCLVRTTHGHQLNETGADHAK